MLQQHLTLGLLLLFVFFQKGFTSPVTGPSTLEAFLGKSLSVKCQYTEGYQDYKKYWCKGPEWNTCIEVVKTDKTGKETRVDRTFIRDNRTQTEFTVRVENITEQDAGIYWCAIERTGADHRSKVIITVIELPSTTISVTTKCSSTVPNFSTENEMNSSESNFYDPIILLPAIFVALMLLLAGASLLMWKLKKKKATKNYKDLPPSMDPPLSDQATDGTEMAYITVTPIPGFASNSQVPADKEGITYASLRYPALNDQTIYANM